MVLSDMPKVIIANTLADGFVCFLTDNGDWSRAILDAALVSDEAEAEALLVIALKAEAANVVIDPYLIDVEIEDGLPRPLVYREYIRAYGPSVPLPS